MERIWKRSWEYVIFWHSFQRLPVKGWLADGETILSVDSVTVTNYQGVDCTTSMVLTFDMDPIDRTKVKYTLMGGIVNDWKQPYTIDFKVETSAGQKLEDKILLDVIA